LLWWKTNIKYYKKTVYNNLLEKYKSFKEKLIKIKLNLKIEINHIQNFIDKFLKIEYENYNNKLKNKNLFEILYTNFLLFHKNF